MRSAAAVAAADEKVGHLQARMDRGDSVSNLRYFRIFYLRYSDR